MKKSCKLIVRHERQFAERSSQQTSLLLLRTPFDPQGKNQNPKTPFTEMKFSSHIIAMLHFSGARSFSKQMLKLNRLLLILIE